MIIVQKVNFISAMVNSLNKNYSTFASSKRNRNDKLYVRRNKSKRYEKENINPCPATGCL